MGWGLGYLAVPLVQCLVLPMVRQLGTLGATGNLAQALRDEHSGPLADSKSHSIPNLEVWQPLNVIGLRFFFPLPLALAMCACALSRVCGRMYTSGLYREEQTCRELNPAP